MAEYVATGDSSPQVLPLTKDKISEYICKNCSAYEFQLKEVLEELESARAIIDILQMEVPTTTTTENTCDEKTNTKGWTTVSSRNNSIKPNKSSLCKILIYCAFVRYLKKWDYSEAVHQLFINFKKSYKSFRREVLYNILISFCMQMKMIRLIKMCRNEIYSRDWVGKHSSDVFP